MSTKPVRSLGALVRRLGVVAGLAVASVAVVAQPAAANIIPPEGVAKPGVTAAGGCWDDGCNYRYYNYGGPRCTDARPKSVRSFYSKIGSSTTWRLDVYYSHACGAGFAYVRNLNETRSTQCYVETWFTFNNGYSWQGHDREPIDAGYTFAYTTMVGDAGPYDKVRGRVSCTFSDAVGGTIWSDWVYES